MPESTCLSFVLSQDSTFVWFLNSQKWHHYPVYPRSSGISGSDLEINCQRTLVILTGIRTSSSVFDIFPKLHSRHGLLMLDHLFRPGHPCPMSCVYLCSSILQQSQKIHFPFPFPLSVFFQNNGNFILLGLISVCWWSFAMFRIDFLSSCLQWIFSDIWRNRVSNT